MFRFSRALKSRSCMWMAVCSAILVAGCSKHPDPVYQEHFGGAGVAYSASAYGEAAPVQVADESAYARDVAPKRSFKLAAASLDMTSGSSDAVPMEPSPESPEPSASTRMVFHEGWISLKSTDPKATLDSAVSLAAQLGGYLESRAGNMVVVRIPVAQFRKNFDRFAALATLLSKNLRADDITEQFQDAELRLRIAKETLMRLQQLLADARDTQEKLSLLREIQRVSQQIDRDESLRKALLQKAAFSRLTLTADPFVFQGEEAEPIGAFRFLSGFNPRRTLEADFHVPALQLPTPKDMVDLEIAPFWSWSDGAWAASASDGSELWARTFENQPQGDAAFWAEVLRIRLGRGFASATVDSLGAWRVVRLRSFDAVPYTWLVAVLTDDDELHVAEAFFPDDTAVAAHQQSVLDVLKGVKP